MEVLREGTLSNCSIYIDNARFRTSPTITAASRSRVTEHGMGVLMSALRPLALSQGGDSLFPAADFLGVFRSRLFCEQFQFNVCTRPLVKLPRSGSSASLLLAG